MVILVDFVFNRYSTTETESTGANGGNDCVTDGGGNIVLRRGRKNIAPVNSTGRRSRRLSTTHSVFISQLNNLLVYISVTPPRLQSSADVTE